LGGGREGQTSQKIMQRVKFENKLCISGKKTTSFPGFFLYAPGKKIPANPAFRIYKNLCTAFTP
jgi:hypothetical protein